MTRERLIGLVVITAVMVGLALAGVPAYYYVWLTVVQGELLRGR